MASKAKTSPRPKAAAKPPVKRPIGRPAADGNSVGREKLLKTACDLLRTVPPNKLTRFMVAQKAGVDPSLIRYYFRDRASLLAAAAERLSDQYTEKLAAELQSAEASGIDQLQARLGLNVNLDVTYAHLRRLLLDELLASSAGPARLAATKIIRRGTEAYRTILEAGAADGTMRDDDPVLLFMAVVALSSYFPSAKMFYELATGQKVSQQAIAEKYRGLITGLVSRGMAAADPVPTAPRRKAKR